MKPFRLSLITILCISLLLVSQPAGAFAGWTSVRTRNLFLISNAGATELRQVASWLELFHAAAGGLLSKRVFNSSVPTVGIVFRNDKEFQPFKPLYQGKPAELAGYFQPGDDVNYIAISLDRENGEPLSAAFHEYVHLFVKDNMPNCPLWLNEGLAEFYSTIELSNDDAVIGTPIGSYIQLLRNSNPLPLAELFSVNGASAHYHERDKRGIFYAESWALVHYLMLGNNGQRQTQVGRYLSLLAAGVSLETAFNMAFQTTFGAMEKELNEYIRRDSFPLQRAGMSRTGAYRSVSTEALSEAEADYYLGDLLMHIGRPADAEVYFNQALVRDPNLIPAHAALGILRARQGRLNEAQRHLQRAAATSQNYQVHFFYSYTLSLQGMNDGKVAGYPAETLNAIRAHLRTSIKLAPDFAEAYHLLAFVNLVANEQLDESLVLIKRAMSLEPNRQDLKLVLAQIYLKQHDTESGRRILEALAKQGDQRLRSRAEALLANSSANVAAPPQISTAAPTRVLSGQLGGDASPGGMRIDASGTLPPVDEVLAKYVASLGGADKIRKLTSRVTRGKARVPGEFSQAAFEVYEKPPNKGALVINDAQTGSLGQGFDGNVGWRQTARNSVSRLKGQDLAELQRDCDFFSPLRLKENYAEVKLLGRVKIGYREAYLVEAKPTLGEPDKFYFEIASGMLIRQDSVRTNWRERAPVEIYYDDWREVEGLKAPFRVTRSSPHFSIKLTVEEIKYNVSIDDSIFTPHGAK